MGPKILRRAIRATFSTPYPPLYVLTGVPACTDEEACIFCKAVADLPYFAESFEQPKVLMQEILKLRANSTLGWDAPIEEWQLFACQLATILMAKVPTMPVLRKALSHWGAMWLSPLQLDQHSRAAELGQTLVQLRTVRHSDTSSGLSEPKVKRGFQFRAFYGLATSQYLSLIHI